MLKSIGADALVDYNSPNWEAQVRKLSRDGEGVDIVYDAIGAVESGIKCLRYRGKLVVVGFAARGGEMEKVAANKILLKGVSVVGYVSLAFFILLRVTH
jgi:transcription elongation factor SPT5